MVVCVNRIGTVERIADQVNSAVEVKIAMLDVGIAARQVERFVEKMKLANESLTWLPFVLPILSGLLLAASGWVLAWDQADKRINQMALQVQMYPEIAAALAKQEITMSLGAYEDKNGHRGRDITFVAGKKVLVGFKAENGSVCVPID